MRSNVPDPLFIICLLIAGGGAVLSAMFAYDASDCTNYQGPSGCTIQNQTKTESSVTSR